MREQTETVRRTTCLGCQTVLDEVTTYSTRELMPDDAAAAAEFKHETDGMPAAATNVNEQSAEFKHETEYISGTTPVSCLKKIRDVPDILVETYDWPAALRLADSYAPDDAAERLAYKTGLTWLQRGEHEKAAALAPNVHDERAHAALLHLAERPPALAPGLRE
jgi:hypothetical protein